MTLKIKFALFFTTLIGLLIGGLVYYISYYTGNYLKRDAISNFRTIAELSASAYFTFTDLVKIRATDWSSDGYIRMMTEKVLDARARGNDEEYRANALTLANYLRADKMKYDTDIIIVDILDA